jgi:tetratricopeptide (TPR) repeat protein
MPNRELLKIERARVLIEMKRYDEAISSANAILEESPERLEALYTRALAEKVKGDDPSAIRDFERIKAKQPWLEDTLLHLGQLYVRHSKVAEGSALLQQFKEKRSLSDNLARLTLQVAHKGDEPDSHLALGQAYLQGGSLARAIVEFRRTLELRPGDTVAKSLLAEALEKNGRTTEAKMIAVTEARGKGFGRE